MVKRLALGLLPISCLILGALFITNHSSWAADKKAASTNSKKPESTDSKKAEQPQFYLAEAKGNVKLVHKGKKKKAVPPQKVEKNDRIVTGKDGKAYLQFKRGGNIEIGPNSDVKVSKMEVDDKSLQAKFKIAFGRMRTILKKLGSSSSTFEIEAGGVTAGVRGTTFEVSYDKDKKTAAAKTFEGSVYAIVDGKEEVLKKGFGLLLHGDGIPVLSALSNGEMKEFMDFIAITDDLDKKKEFFEDKLKQTLLGGLMGDDADAAKDAADKADDAVKKTDDVKDKLGLGALGF